MSDSQAVTMEIRAALSPIRMPAGMRGRGSEEDTFSILELFRLFGSRLRTDQGDDDPTFPFFPQLGQRSVEVPDDPGDIAHPPRE
jgi:hypothetical protein